MRKIFLSSICFALSIMWVNAQTPQGIFNNIKKKLKKDTTSSGADGSLTTDDVVSGLKEALNNGVNTGTAKLSAIDGFFANAAIKILMPPEAEKVEKTLRNVGLGKEVDNAILSMNRAAEDAAKSAAPIFLDAVKHMSISDAWGILRGGDTAATAYLRKTTTASLTNAFKPVIDKSLEKVDATKYWNTVFTAYNKVSLNKINPDLSAYVTDKALYGIFYEIAQQEVQIRKDPVARTTDILKKVFGK
ncbi:MAG TPA: DUF4197 domain-containing protein [Chitinophagaceae bacterium]|jgi:hypothetical protein